MSIYYGNVRLVNDIAPGLTLASGEWTRARLLIERTEGGALLTIQLTAEGGATVTAVEDYFLPGFELVAGRLVLSASQGGNTSDQLGSASCRERVCQYV